MQVRNGTYAQARAAVGALQSCNQMQCVFRRPQAQPKVERTRSISNGRA